MTGSRAWTGERVIARALVDAVSHAPFYGPDAERITVVHGACPRGADAIADRLARRAGWTVEAHPAAWDTHGRSAGPQRNQAMVELGADITLAFILDSSRGASDCADRAERAGIPTKRYAVRTR